MLGNLKRSRFIAAVLVFLVYLVKLKYPEFPHEAAYGFIAYILGESAADAVKWARSKPDENKAGEKTP